MEWVAISFSNAWKWKVKVKLLSRVRLLVTPWTTAHQAPPSMGFSRQEYWSGLPSSSQTIPGPGQSQLTDFKSNCLFFLFPTPRFPSLCCSLNPSSWKGYSTFLKTRWGRPFLVLNKTSRWFWYTHHLLIPGWVSYSGSAKETMIQRLKMVYSGFHHWLEEAEGWSLSDFNFWWSFFH